MNTEITLVYIILGIIYTLLLIYTLIRVLNSKNFVGRWRQARYLYYFQFLELTIRSCYFWLICALSSLDIFQSYRLSFILLSLPQDLIICCYITLFWIMLTSSIVTRFNSSADRSSLDLNLSSLRKFQRAAKFFLIFWIALDLVLYLLVFLDLVQPFDLVIQHSVLGFSASLLVIISIAATQVKYSGIPFISDRAQVVMRRVLTVVIAWSLGIIIHGILYLIREQNLLSNSPDLNGTEADNPAASVILISDLLITEVICFVFVNEHSFFEIFSQEIDDFPVLPLIEPLSPLDYAVPKMELNVKPDEVYIENELSSLPNKLGKLLIGRYKGLEVAIRRVNLHRVNNYVIENVYGDLSVLSSICCPHYCQPLGVCVNGEFVDILMPYFRYGSLFSNLQKKHFNYLDKLRIAREIAFCFKIFHTMGQVHGHLTSSNVFIDSAYRAVVSDLGLSHLKKYCGITSKYINKTAWTSPQLFNEAGNVAVKVAKSDDAYSFGIVLWEILTDEVPFPGLSPKQLQTMLNQGYRPGIPGLIDPDLGELMKSCWNIEPASRPSFQLIHNTLCLVLAKEKGTESFFSAEG